MSTTNLICRRSRICRWHMMLLLWMVTVLDCLRLLSITTIITTVPTAQAYSNGAGACMGGMAAVGGFHLDAQNSETGADRTVLSGELSEGMVSVLIDNNANTPLDFTQPYNLNTQTDFTITVVTTSDRGGYKGILLRFSNADNTIDAATQILLEPVDSLLQISTVCGTDETNTVGLTHTDNSEKTSVNAIIRFDAPGTVQLDITIVGANDDKVSVYGYTGFILEVTGDPYVAPTSTPTLSPTKEKVTLPPGETATPTTSPTLSDLITDTLSPTYEVIALIDSNNNSNLATPTRTVPVSPTSSSERATLRTSLALWAVITPTLLLLL
jgi:hypothetical protein